MYRLRYAERKVYIVFDAHPISGVLFVFRGKPSNMSQTENSAKPKGEFFMMTAITTLLKNERGDAHEEIKKQNIIYGA